MGTAKAAAKALGAAADKSLSRVAAPRFPTGAVDNVVEKPLVGTVKPCKPGLWADRFNP